MHEHRKAVNADSEEDQAEEMWMYVRDGMQSVAAEMLGEAQPRKKSDCYEEVIDTLEKRNAVRLRVAQRRK